MGFLGNDCPKHALVIGINYIGTTARLNGCVNDAQHVEALLSSLGFADITMLTDDTPKKPTKQQILDELQALVDRATPDCEIWISYSGHGSYVADQNNDERDGRDEVLVPLDYDQSGVITDDALRSYLEQLPACRVTVLVDACHSGTALDLPCVYPGGHQEAGPLTCSCIMLSGCTDNQTSADAYLAGKYQGAMTNSFLKAVGDFPHLSAKGITDMMRAFLKSAGFEQLPLLSVSHRGLLDVVVLGDGGYNVNINIEGDGWCNTESSWNLVSGTTLQPVFAHNKTFSMRNQSLLYPMHLDDGSYVLVLNDSYGDGGLRGTVTYASSGVLITKFVFSSGTSKSVEFTVDSSKDVPPQTKSVEIHIAVDHWFQEMSYCIVDAADNKISDVQAFLAPYEAQVFVMDLLENKYWLKLTDTWGDGGCSGAIKVGTKETHFRFDSGFTKSVEFSV